MADQSTQQSGGSGQSRTDRYKEMIDWRETAVVGVVAWAASLVLTLAILMISGVTDESGVDTLDLSIGVLFESIGGTMGEDGTVALGQYLLLDTDYFGPALFFHAVIPAIVLIIAGYVLASRHESSGRTSTPYETVIAGVSSALVFAALMFLAVLIVDDDGGIDIDFAEVIVVSLLYPLVFTAIGSTISTRAALSSMRGFVAGIVAFVAGFGIWYFLDDPFDEPISSIFQQVSGAPESFSDLDDAWEQLAIFHEFVLTHGLEPGAVLPEWYAMLVPLIAGAVVAYLYEVTDPIAGMGKGAKVGVGYAVVVTLLVLVAAATYIREAIDNIEGDWPDEFINELNFLAGTFPRTVIIAGIVVPVAFAAIGGALGAMAFESQNPDAGAQPRGREARDATDSPTRQAEPEGDQDTSRE